MKKVYITEAQAELIVNHIKNEKTINESWKDVVLGVALLAGISLTGHNKAQAQTALEDSKVLAQVQSVLQDERLSKVVDSLESAGLNNAEEYIKKNARKIEKKFDQASVRVKGVKGGVKVYYGDEVKKVEVSKYPELVKKLKAGYAITEISQDTIRQIMTDTVQGESVVDTLKLPYNVGDLFGSGKFVLSQDGKTSIKEILDSLQSQGYSVIGVNIESSTDKQRVSDDLNRKVGDLGYKTGNEGLSQVRNDQIKKVLLDLGVDTTLIKQTVKFNEGRGKLGAVNPQDASARYVTLQIDMIKIADEAPEDKVITTVEEVIAYNFELARVTSKRFSIRLPKMSVNPSGGKKGKCNNSSCPSFK
jgi:outer membrane protein OmpA-like peptidoglycan-associated protein|tara:strand:+ start:3316 stop:4398 length:1083 start_codon:yes stop_codon:yes gene_type:complete